MDLLRSPAPLQRTRRQPAGAGTKLGGGGAALPTNILSFGRQGSHIVWLSDDSDEDESTNPGELAGSVSGSSDKEAVSIDAGFDASYFDMSVGPMIHPPVPEIGHGGVLNASVRETLAGPSLASGRCVPPGLSLDAWAWQEKAEKVQQRLSFAGSERTGKDTQGPRPVNAAVYESKNGSTSWAGHPAAGAPQNPLEAAKVDVLDEPLPPGIPTVGTLGHATGCCKPCFFIHTPKGCQYGKDCIFCHAHPKVRPTRPMKASRAACQRLVDGVFRAQAARGAPVDAAMVVLLAHPEFPGDKVEGHFCRKLLRTRYREAVHACKEPPSMVKMSF